MAYELEHITLPDGTTLNITGGTPSGLGNLAYKDSASGNVTPSGTVTSSFSDASTYKSVSQITSYGSLPSLVFNTYTHVTTFSAGSLPKATNYTCASTVAGTISSSFSGSSSSVTVS